MYIFDTSVWIDALNGKFNKKVKFLREMIESNQVVLTPTIIQEILQGIKFDEQFQKVKTNLKGFTILTSDPIETAIGAATLYRDLRKKGITIRKSNDCLIAYSAIAHNLLLVHNDADFDLIATGTKLRIESI